MTISILISLALTTLMAFVVVGVIRSVHDDKLQSNKTGALAVLYAMADMESQIYSVSRIFAEESDELTSDEGVSEVVQAALNAWRDRGELPGLVINVWYVDSGNQHVARLVYGDSEERNESIWEIVSIFGHARGRVREEIYLDENGAYLTVPLWSTWDIREPGDKPAALILSVSIDVLVGDYFLERVREHLRDPGSGILRMMPDISAAIMSGSDLEALGASDHNLVYDLSPRLNSEVSRSILGVWTDDLKRYEGGPLVGNHNYLVLQPLRGTNDGFFNRRLFFTLALVFVLYAFLLITMLVLAYRSWQIRNARVKEQDFIALVSHELKTPLSVITLAGKNLSSSVISSAEGVKEYGEMISAESAKLRSLIEDILTLSTQGWESRSAHNASLKLGEFCQTVVNDLQPSMRSMDITVETTIENPGLTFICNESSLVMALRNLLINAAKYGASNSEDRQIRFEVKGGKRGGVRALVFTVSDNGPGVSWSEQKDIFRPFYRGNAVQSNSVDVTELQQSSDRKALGTGLGLTLSKKIAKYHGGDLLLQRRKPGATFELWIALHSDAGEYNEEYTAY